MKMVALGTGGMLHCIIPFSVGDKGLGAGFNCDIPTVPSATQWKITKLSHFLTFLGN